MKLSENLKKNQRVVTFLNRAEIDFLDKLGKDALFSTGSKLSRAKIIAWLVDFMKELNINGKNIKSERDFENRIREIIGQKGVSPTSPATEGL
ncbi:MAG: hypothetical protein AMJ95_01640 [Omnitrophica WOR_2 bacterium SM23_72]|nr:MAG: hypothetical protein AMJ95_01640 [Omnitrophica WOR_2 bacterium SM23_72]